MPAGVSWGQYLRFSTAAFASMMAGSQVVHYYYRPLEDLQAYVEKERILRRFLLFLITLLIFILPNHQMFFAHSVKNHFYSIL